MTGRKSMSDLGPWTVDPTKSVTGVCAPSYEDVVLITPVYEHLRTDILSKEQVEMLRKGSLPTDAASRKASPLAEGLLYYFPNALAAVAAVSKAGNDQHNPGQPLHHSRGKSADHADCIMRHLIDAGTMDTDGHRHSAKVAWRALALLQEELEQQEGAPLPRNAKPKDSI